MPSTEFTSKYRAQYMLEICPKGIIWEQIWSPLSGSQFNVPKSVLRLG